ncbi:MAG TPA: glutamate--tRNA ligase family protein [Gemmatimonadaceae bacterium]|nr:glutamate--tRNA ligase family protein [Gemmatimonadaceae bacterium]
MTAPGSQRSLAERLSLRVTPGWRTRFAPAPTGALHLGHAVNAVMVWGLARALDGAVVLRVEDHDRGRSRASHETGILDDLDWLGLVPDVGATTEFRAGAHALRQSDNDDRYAGALAQLASQGLTYACACSRADIAGVAGDVFGAESPYPGTCRARALDPATTHATRVRLPDTVERFDDVALGAQQQVPATQCGDPLLRDRAGNWTYQFAVVVDDAEQGIDVVIRGEDLLQSTGRQIAIARMLGRVGPPVFLHHALVRHDDGSKLSKSRGDASIAELRAAGRRPEQVFGEAARLAGLQRDAASITASDLAGLFN